MRFHSTLCLLYAICNSSEIGVLVLNISRHHGPTLFGVNFVYEIVAKRFYNDGVQSGARSSLLPMVYGTKRMILRTGRVWNEPTNPCWLKDIYVLSKN